MQPIKKYEDITLGNGEGQAHTAIEVVMLTAKEKMKSLKVYRKKNWKSHRLGSDNRIITSVYCQESVISNQMKQRQMILLTRTVPPVFYFILQVLNIIIDGRCTGYCSITFDQYGFFQFDIMFCSMCNDQVV